MREKHIPTHPGVPSDASAPSKGARGKGQGGFEAPHWDTLQKELKVVRSLDRMEGMRA